jgi:predicted negative regulator of RcsB-dependent stress response
LKRFFLPGILLVALTARAAAPEKDQLDADLNLFTVLAAINAAGYDADLSSPNNSAVRAAVRKELAGKNIPSLPRLKEFYAAHKQTSATADLSQYVSFALSTQGPPTFALKGRTIDWPPDAAPLESLGPILADFFSEAGIQDLWDRDQRDFEKLIEQYHAPVSEAVLQVNSYARNETAGVHGRWFQIYVDLLGAPNQIQTRSYANLYYVVITPSAEPRVRDVRHAYLHYLLDPLATRHEEIVMHKQSLAADAMRAPALDPAFQSDFLLLTTESLIQAIECRLDHRPAGIDEAMREGYILTAYFAEQLPVYEKQEEALRFYYPEMIKGIDPRVEEARIAKIQFDAEPAVRQAKVVHQQAPPEPQGVYKTLQQAEQLYVDRSLEPARELYLKALEETRDKPLHAKAYYGLARIAALEKNPELADSLFLETLESQPEPQIHACALVYLGRLEDAAGEHEQAKKRYQQALAVEGASPAAHQAAEEGAQRSFQKSN